MNIQTEILDTTLMIRQNADFIRAWEPVDVRLYSIESDTEPDRYVIEWWDGVANTFKESFGQLSHALVRLAALVACGEEGWDKNFRHNAENFAPVASTVLDQLTQ